MSPENSNNLFAVLAMVCAVFVAGFLFLPQTYKSSSATPNWKHKSYSRISHPPRPNVPKHPQMPNPKPNKPR